MKKKLTPNHVPDRKLRTASLDSLKTFLSTRIRTNPLQLPEALRLWKGLYFALWMTDRPGPQQRLAADLASLADDGGDESASSSSFRAVWFAAFWDVIGQQWPQIDRHRMDKFLLLVRRVFAAHVRHARGDADVAGVLAEWPFEGSGDLRRVPLGVRLHVLDLWVDELEREGILAEGEEEGSDGRVRVERVGEMVQGLLHCPVKQVRERARESYDDERLPWAKKGDEDEEEGAEEEEEEWGGIDG